MTDPPPFNLERQIVATDRLRLLSLGYYISGAIGAAFVSFLLIHFFLLLGLSFIPPSAWNAHSPTPPSIENVSPIPFAKPGPISNNAQAPPAIMFRIFAGVIGLIIICGWTLGALTAYAGHCIRNRKHKVFIYVMAALNCIWIPYGTILGVATILLFQWPEVQSEFKTSPCAR